ncbi:MAG: transcription elongation factor GreA [Armatimonadota bacterium]|nr:transcription elongation factor GreA [Armatimonadota bacterium]
MPPVQPRFTRESYERLNKELEELKAQREGIRGDIRDAREQGDLRENFAYHAAKDAQGLLEARINSLELQLADAVIIEAGESQDEVVIGVPVTVRPVDGADDDLRTYTIVTAEELDYVDDAASADSPIGSALLGKKVGDIIAVQGPRGTVRFEVVSIGG